MFIENITATRKLLQNRQVRKEYFCIDSFALKLLDYTLIFCFLLLKHKYYKNINL